MLAPSSSVSPPSRIRLRPSASEINPTGMNASAMPSMYTVTVFWTTSFDAANSAAIVGSAGVYTSSPI